MTADANEERFMAKLRAKLVTSPRPPHPGSRWGHEVGPPGLPAPGLPAAGTGAAGSPLAGKDTGAIPFGAALHDAPSDPRAACAEVWPLARRFAQELAAVGGRAELCPDVDQFASRLAAACREAGVSTIVIEPDARWERPEFMPLRRALDDTGCAIGVLDGGRPVREVAAHADAGLTIADFAIAESGTVGLWTGAGRTRVASLLPPVHLVLLPVAAIVATRGEAMRRLTAKAAREGFPSQTIFITGPSRTGDIEGELTVGVHGPGKVQAFIVDTGGTP